MPVGTPSKDPKGFHRHPGFSAGVRAARMDLDRDRTYTENEPAEAPRFDTGTRPLEGTVGRVAYYQSEPLIDPRLDETSLAGQPNCAPLRGERRDPLLSSAALET